MADRIIFTIPGQPKYATMVRLAVGSIATEAGFSVEDVEDIKVATEEACKSICCHGNEGFPSKMEIECEVEEGRLEVKVVDKSEGISTEKIQQICMDCPKEGDLSLCIIQSLMNEVEVQTHAQGEKFIKLVKVRG